MDSEKSKPGPKKKSKAEFLEGKKNPFANSDMGSCIFVPILFPRLFLLVFPIYHARRRLLYKRTLKFNKENVIVTLLYCLGIPAKIISLAVNARGAIISLVGGKFC